MEIPLDSQSITAIVSLIVGALTSHGIHLTLAKQKLDQVRRVFDLVDDAVNNDKIDEPTFKAIWAAGKTLVSVPQTTVKK